MSKVGRMCGRKKWGYSGAEKVKEWWIPPSGGKWIADMLTTPDSIRTLHGVRSGVRRGRSCKRIGRKPKGRRDCLESDAMGRRTLSRGGEGITDMNDLQNEAATFVM